MIIALNVHGAPYATQASATALRFAEAALLAGHSIHRVFFFHEGALTGNRLVVAPQDERSPQAGWISLAEQHDIELAICIATALKRGVVGSAEQAQYELAAANLHDRFVLVGLAQLIEAMSVADRTITFS